MSAAVDIYIPAKWHTSISDVLTAAGFQVASQNCKLAGGTAGRQYSCTRDGANITLTEIPLRDDPAYLAVLGRSRTKHRAELLVARDALTEHGALDSDTYNQRSRNP
jgi:hypothetical protein